MSPPYDLVVTSRRAVLPDGERPATVAVRDGRIVAVEEGVAAGDRVAAEHGAAVPGARERVDLGDVALLPGLVDSHVHVNEPGRTEWEGFATATRAAVAGGVTTIVDMPLNCLPPTTGPEALAVKRAAAEGRCHADVGFWGGAVPGNLAALRPLHEAGVFGFKCFLSPSGVDEFPPLTGPDLPAAVAEIAAFGGLVLVHAEDPAALGEPAGGGYADFLRSRPPGAELSAVRTVIDLVARTGARAHILHVSAAGGADLVAEARGSGLPVTAETCPHYLTLSAEEVRGTAFKCCPPIRPAANREELWRALGRGAIGCVVSDHSPCVPELKAGDFASAWGGISSLELGLPAVWTAARARGHGLRDVVRWMAEGPAELAGLPAKGRIETGRDADLVAFAPDDTFTVAPARLRQRHPLTPYAGRELSGVVRKVWLRGRVAGGEPRGRLLRRCV